MQKLKLKKRRLIESRHFIVKIVFSLFYSPMKPITLTAKFFRLPLAFRTLILSGLVVALVACSGDGSQSVEFAWVQFGPDGYQVRAITSRAACPIALVRTAQSKTESKIPLSTRALPSGDDFPNRVCELNLPKNTQAVTIAEYGLDMTVKDQDIKKFAILGDTGCRIKVKDGSSDIQACNDLDEWPFPTVSSSIATKEFDAIIHTGDILYRESPCPEGNKGCAGSPYGYGYSGFEADFFDPAIGLLRTRPWIFVRGNHEKCGRAGIAWTRYFSPWPIADGQCREFEQPYTLDFGTVQLLVMDTSASHDLPPLVPGQIEHYRGQFEELAKVVDKDRSWLLAHHPVWAFRIRGTDSGEPAPASQTLIAAIVNDQGDQILETQAVIAGHVHNFTLFDYGDSMPQLIIGNAGALLDLAFQQDQVGLKIGERTIKRLTSFSDFGFSLAELQQQRGWEFIQFDKDGNPYGVSCTLKERTCVEAGGNPVPLVCVDQQEKLLHALCGSLVIYSVSYIYPF
ncbi:metallophosphoesterase [Microbulbifer sp. GL-2]|uniref:metallophosphoesterase family protein n=1 Tax=Microbulbifer sp. GL-2 TaxID=2591606 RepID=UPI00155AC5AF|nr:metallophosphoesterase [Microbulbifer sp. GL-2]